MDKSKARCSAFDKAVNLLAFKDRTKHEIISKLKEKGYSSEEIEDAVDKLSYYGYLNDQNYTISYIKDNTSKKGKRLIINELGQKGIDRFIIESACEEVEMDEISVIENIVKKRFSQINLSDEKSYRRVVNYFLRRGFAFDNVKKVLKHNIFKNDMDEYYC